MRDSRPVVSGQCGVMGPGVIAPGLGIFVVPGVVACLVAGVTGFLARRFRHGERVFRVESGELTAGDVASL